MPTLEYKYVPGQEVFYKTTKWTNTSAPCLDCGGTGSLIRKDGKEIICPSCKGKKTYKIKDKLQEFVVQDEVDHIEIYIERGDIEVTYFLEDRGNLSEDELFETEKDCIATFTLENNSTAKIVKNNNFTFIPKEDWGVHIQHCCKRHGCKYGDYDNCPVVLGLATQDHPCEDCNIEDNNYPF